MFAGDFPIFSVEKPVDSVENSNSDLLQTVNFSNLIQLIQFQFPLHPRADQVIAVETSKGITRFFANNLGAGTLDEDRFVQSLLDQNDTSVKLLVCMWSNGCMDLPSMDYDLITLYGRHCRERKLLVETNSENEHTLMLLQATDRPVARTIRWSMP